MTDIHWQLADAMGPAKIVYLQDTKANLRAIVVVDNVACGPAIGGCRMAPDVSLDECRRLARAMTLKNAAARLAHGGGKSVIAAHPGMKTADKEALVRSFARAIDQLEDYIVGPDMGTDETCMAWCHDEIGRAVGLPPELGGIPLDELGATAFGLSIAAQAAQPFCDFDLDGARVVIEGFGSVGRHAATFLDAEGVRLVAAADSGGLTKCVDGLDAGALVAHKNEGRGMRDFEAGVAGELDELLDIECDIFVPAARPDVVRADNVDRLTARLVLPGANIAITEEAEVALHARGVLVLPDYIANAGGVICAAAEYHGHTQADAFRAIEETIGANTERLLHESRTGDVTPRVAATNLARQRVEDAMRFRK